MGQDCGECGEPMSFEKEYTNGKVMIHVVTFGKFTCADEAHEQ